jgi:hypothetical protein
MCVLRAKRGRPPNDAVQTKQCYYSKDRKIDNGHFFSKERESNAASLSKTDRAIWFISHLDLKHKL